HNGRARGEHFSGEGPGSRVGRESDRGREGLEVQAGRRTEREASRDDCADRSDVPVVLKASLSLLRLAAARYALRVRRVGRRTRSAGRISSGWRTSKKIDWHRRY